MNVKGTNFKTIVFYYNKLMHEMKELDDEPHVEGHITKKTAQQGYAVFYH